MSSALVDSLQLVDTALPADVVPGDARPGVADLAAALAPVPCCGWEMRLDEDPTVDFHQGIPAGDGAPARLLAHLRRHGSTGGGLEELVAGWCDAGSALSEAVSELWLEFDRPPLGDLSVFIGFRRDPPVAWNTVGSIVDLVVGRDRWGDWRESVGRCFAALPAGAIVSHVGVMLERDRPCFRLNVARISQEAQPTYLSAVGWPGDLAQTRELTAALSPLCEGVTLCLDVDDAVRARLGLECSLRAQPPEEPRWEALLDELVQRGWCRPDKRAALLRWPGVETPLTGEWPTSMLRDSLVAPADRFTSVQRSLSHVKVDLRPDGPVRAKAYLEARHRWLLPPEAQGGAAMAGPRRRRAEGAGDAAAGAAEFLVGSRDGVGWWTDFRAAEDSAGRFEPGDEWVSAMAGTALAAHPAPRAREAARRAWQLLLSRRSPRDGWGYGRHSPVDAESTSWGVRLAAAVGAADSPRARRARETLEAHLMPDGAVVTYRPEVCPRPTGPGLLPPDGSYAGWEATGHADIAAPVAMAGVEAARRFLRGTQQDDGGWRAYWWEDDEYPTALAAQALRRAGETADRERIARAVRWAASRVGADGSVRGSPFATAWALCTLRLASDDEPARDALKRGLTWLVEHQEADGGWRASARMLSPRPDLLERPDPFVGRTAIDHARIFTTASVLFALTEPAA